MYSILVADGNDNNLQLLKQVLMDQYIVIPVQSGGEALQNLEKHKPDLILLDYLLPEMDGKETMKMIRNNPDTASIPIIMLTEDTTGLTEAECLRLGATDFITKPFAKEVIVSRVEKTLELESYRHDLQQQLYEKSRQIEHVTLQAITVVANAIDAKDIYTKGHSFRVAEYASAIAEELGYSDRDIQNIHYVALLHDIGKIGVPDNILVKPAKLTENEYDVIKTHTTIGADVLKDVQMIKEAKEGALSHHERYDGKGYPEGLTGEKIPAIARILCLADAYDAMTSDRIFRKRLSSKQAIEEIRKGSGAQFDPNIAPVFLKLLEGGLNLAKLKVELRGEQNRFLEESSMLLQRVMKEREARVEREAARDYLTGLFNRRATEIQVNQYLREKGHKGAFFIIDLDNFKSVNDNYGHIAGDYVLKKVALLLSNNARDSDIVCRLGGDEFVMFFKGLFKRDILIKKAKRLINEFSVLRTSDETMSQTSLSMGITLSGIDGDDFESLYVTADKSLYYVKQNGKNAYHFYSDDQWNLEEEQNIATLVDIQHLMEMMKETDEMKGVLAVGYGEFQRIYNFIQRCVERTRQEVQVLLFTLSNQRGAIISTEMMEESVEILEQAIYQSLRRSDVSTRYSNSQFIVVLINTKYEGAKIVVERVSSLFSDMNVYETLVLAKDIAQMTGDYEETTD